MTRRLVAVAALLLALVTAQTILVQKYAARHWTTVAHLPTSGHYTITIHARAAPRLDGHAVTTS